MRRLALVLTGALLAALVTALVGSAQQRPRVMNVGCALKKGGALRFVAKASKCKRRERVVRVSPSSQPVKLCARKAVRAAARCKRRERKLTLPAAGRVFFCARRRGGKLRFVTSAACRKGEFAVVVRPAGNRPPIARPDSATTDEDTPLAVPVLANDTDADRDRLSVVGDADFDPRGRFDSLAPGESATDTFEYRATDGRARSRPATVTVRVTGVNDTPALSGIETAETIATIGGAPVAVTSALVIADPDDENLDGATVRVASGFDAASDELQFTNRSGITGTYDSGTGVLTLAGSASKVDYQAALRSVSFRAGNGTGGVRRIEFRVTDGTAQSNLASREVRVNAAPTAIALSHTKIAATEPPGATVGLLSTSDTDAGDTHTYTVVEGAGFAIDGATLETDGELAEGAHEVLVRSDDGRGGNVEQRFEIEVVPANAAPTDLALTPGSVDENAADALVGNLTTTDPDGGPPTYALVPGAGSGDNGRFRIDGATLKTDAALDFEAQSTYSVRIRTNDGRFAGSHEEAVPITANDLNETPTLIALSNATIAENVGNTTVGSFSTTDQDAGDGHAYTLVAGTGSTDNARFTISGAALRTKAGGLNFEAQPSYSIRVRSTDSGGLQREDQFTIVTTDANDPPNPDDDIFDGERMGIPNTTYVMNDPTDAAPDPSGPRKTVTGDLQLNDSDEDQPPQPLSIVPATNHPTLDGGRVDIDADGDFVYRPRADTSCDAGEDAFTYAVSDGIATTDAKVRIDFVDACPWYVDANAATHGVGTAASPFKTLADVDGGTDEDAPGDTLFLYPGTYGGSLPLENDQKLLSKRHGLTIDGTLLEVAAPGGARSTLTGGVVLGSGNELQGIDLDTDGVVALTGTSVGNATVNTATSGSVASLGAGAIDISGGTLNMALELLFVQGGSGDGVRLNNVNGTVTIADGLITGSGGQGVDISGPGSASFTYDGRMDTISGGAVSISGQTGGTKDFNGSISSTTGPGILLANNTGATIRFDGGIDVAASGAGNDALRATGGGTLAVTGASNRLFSQAAAAVHVSGVTIHDDDLTFRSLRAPDPAVNGILLHNTANANGRLVVTGNGGTCASSANCSGGEVQDAGDDGISLLNVPGGLSLTRMFVGLNGNANLDFGIEGDALTGTVTLDNMFVTDNFDSGVHVENASGTMNLNVTGGTFSEHGPGAQGSGISVDSQGTGGQHLNVQGATFANNFGSHVIHTGSATETADSDVTVNQSTLTQPPPPNGLAGGGIFVVHGAPTTGPGSNTDLTITNNNIQNSVGAAPIFVDTTGGSASPDIANIDALIHNNTIGTAGQNRSGSISGDGITVSSNGNSNVRAVVTDNEIRQWFNQNAIHLRATDGPADLEATVKDNLITEPPTDAEDPRGMTIQLGVLSGDVVDVCLDIGDSDDALKNTLTNANDDGDPAIRWQHQGAASSPIRLVGLSGTGNEANITTALTARNTITGPLPLVSGIFPSGANVTTATACEQPTF